MRIEGWESRMDKALQETGAFAWGTNDCCMFVFRVAEAITGIDYAKPYRGYKTASGAAKRLVKYDGVEGMATNSFGESKNKLLAKRGDVVSFDTQDGIALGLCIGDKIAAMSQNGLVFISMKNAIRGWSV